MSSEDYSIRSAREEQRLAALADFEVLDTPREPEFDEVAALASEICGTPIAVVNLIAERRQFFKAEVGLGVRETPLETSFCVHAILEQDFLVVPDASKDARFEGNPLVTGKPHLRFYAGALLKTSHGIPIGTVCVLDFEPRDLTDLQRRTLRTLARQVMAQLELRRALRHQTSVSARHTAILDSATDYAIIAMDLAGRVTEWNEGAKRVLGWSEAEMLGKPADLFFTEEDRAADVPAIEMTKALTLGRGMDERWHMRKSGERFWASGELMPLRGDGDVPQGFIKILRDRTGERLNEQRVLEDASRLRLAQEAGRVGTFEVDVRTDTMMVTPQFCRLFGLPVQSTYPTAALEDLIVPEDLAVRSTPVTRADGSAASDVEYRVRRADDGCLRWIERRAEFVRDENGTVVRMLGIAHDITDQRLATIRKTAFLELGDRLRLATTSLDAVSTAAEILGTTLDVLRAGYAIVDSKADTFTIERDWTSGGRSIAGQFSLQAFATTVARLRDGLPVAIENVATTPWLSPDASSYEAIGATAVIAVPMIEHGELVGILFVHDEARRWDNDDVQFAQGVADRTHAALAKIAAEEHQALLHQELGHRLKNTLAMVQAVANQTLKGAKDRDAVRAFDARIQALSKAHDVLLNENWVAAPIGQVVRGALAIHGEPDRIEVEGPDVDLNAQASLSLSLILHELATNALKYGSLATNGSVRLQWTVEHRDRAELVVRWIERGGPEVVAPSRKGFGSRLITKGIGGPATVDYDPAGIKVELRAPLDALRS